jgi:hypothetical protein
MPSFLLGGSCQCSAPSAVAGQARQGKHEVARSCMKCPARSKCEINHDDAEVGVVGTAQ